MHRKTQTMCLEVQRILKATGIGRLTETGDPLIERGLLRLAPVGLNADAGLRLSNPEPIDWF